MFVFLIKCTKNGIFMATYKEFLCALLEQNYINSKTIVSSKPNIMIFCPGFFIVLVFDMFVKGKIFNYF